MRFVLLPWSAAILTLGFVATAAGQVPRDAEPPAVLAQQARERIFIDGRLHETAWNDAQPTTRFWQRDPSEGEPATEQTDLRILYDEHALYAGIRLLDRVPANIVARMSRRTENLCKYGA